MQTAEGALTVVQHTPAHPRACDPGEGRTATKPAECSTEVSSCWPARRHRAGHRVQRRGRAESAQTITLQTGPQAGQTLLVTVAGARSNDLGVSAINISSVGTAVGTLSIVDVALQSINNLRAQLGALQNRLEFTIATLNIQEENAAASESAIRDADIALETQDFTRNQILVSAGTTVLAQANIVPQTALQLLGG